MESVRGVLKRKVAVERVSENMIAYLMRLYVECMVHRLKAVAYSLLYVHFIVTSDIMEG